MLAVIIPCYKSKQHILNVIHKIGPEVQSIYVVDDHCPDQTGKHVTEHCTDGRVKVLSHSKNQGVGGAVQTGYAQAIKDGATIMVKIDSDDQMDPSLIPKFTKPIAAGLADYTKGNRFYYLEHLKEMPIVRVIGNAGLSFINKLSSGYWNIMDPTNGYTAIHSEVAKKVMLNHIDKRYFFESDMLFLLNIIRAVVVDVQIPSKYKNETSHLSIVSTLFTFPLKHAVRLVKRIFYNYFLRDFNIGSLSLLAAIGFTSFGIIFGGYEWYQSYTTKTPALTGTIMLATISILLGVQTLLFFLQLDVTSVPKSAIHGDLES